MTTRRRFLLAAPAATIASAPCFAGAYGEGARATAGKTDLQSLMVEHLSRELGDSATAARLAPYLFEAGFNWRYPKIRVQEANSIIAFSFGNRFRPGRTEADAGRLPEDEVYEPGPINIQLAAAVNAIRRNRAVPVYAQWEIAQILADTFQMKDVVPIHSSKDDKGNIIYLSTDGVAKAAVRIAGSTAVLGKAAIVGHRDHVKRCIMMAGGAGIDAAAVDGIDLPTAYDAASGQPWTRRRDLYLIGDILAQMAVEREQLLKDNVALP